MFFLSMCTSEDVLTDHSWVICSVRSPVSTCVSSLTTVCLHSSMQHHVPLLLKACTLELYFSTLYSCVRVINILHKATVCYCYLYKSAVVLYKGDRSKTCYVQTLNQLEKLLLHLNQCKLQAGQEKFRQSNPGKLQFWGLANTEQRTWFVTGNSSTILQGYILYNILHYTSSGSYIKI